MTQNRPSSEHTNIPSHIAIIMDGNGRWAKKRFMPRIMGHKKGLDALQQIVRISAQMGVQYLTVFAFSTENWRRPPEEVNFLMGLFMESLNKQVLKLHQNNLRLKVIGSKERFSPEIVKAIADAETLTQDNTGLTLTVAADYGGRWDIVHAVNQLHAQGVTHITEALIKQQMSLADAPEPDLFIRTGGETRISNFMLWQLAYTELYFTNTLWPDFNQSAFQLAIDSFNERERRFGRASEQLPIEEQRNPC